jgi:hypothetical protein
MLNSMLYRTRDIKPKAQSRCHPSKKDVQTPMACCAAHKTVTLAFQEVWLRIIGSLLSWPPTHLRTFLKFAKHLKLLTHGNASTAMTSLEPHALLSCWTRGARSAHEPLKKLRTFQGNPIVNSKRLPLLNLSFVANLVKSFGSKSRARYCVAVVKQAKGLRRWRARNPSTCGMVQPSSRMNPID